MSEVDAFDVDDLARDLVHIRDAIITEYKNSMKDFAGTNSYKIHLYELNVRDRISVFFNFNVLLSPTGYSKRKERSTHQTSCC